MAGLREKQFPTIRNDKDEFQRDVRNVVRNITESPLLKGVLAQRVDVTTSVKRIPHTLGRVPMGFFLVDATADVRVWRDSSQAATATDLPLIASATATVSLWIF